MTSAHTDKHGTVEPVTDRIHETSWSANLEKPQHAADIDLVIAQALTAIELTAPGNHVNLVTHGDHDHPETFLFDALENAVENTDITWEYIKQCGCGGHVTRVHVE
ncbi:CGCGG family putative rSAM-modified RiPP protein [Haladaptatus sp. ZSTT2]|uniref:CGCGG family putative rSAM-modified RiPP protein n=1 Tax=Haladaptatus sp. ZSTT2 TaxID=3120515 RepID=UPI00300EC843